MQVKSYNIVNSKTFTSYVSMRKCEDKDNGLTVYKRLKGFYDAYKIIYRSLNLFLKPKPFL